MPHSHQWFRTISITCAAFISLTLLPAVVSAQDERQTAASEDAAPDGSSAATGTQVMTTRDAARLLPPPKEDGVFHFVVYGDRTGGSPAGLKVLEQAVRDTNLLDPDLVMTVGDLIQGYNEKPEWMQQMKEYKGIMSHLNMAWYPVAGNHDVYWRGEGLAPQGHHEANYEKHFGPLWYSFQHKNAGFIVLYSDEGDPVTNTKAFNQGKLQRMSDAQLAFLDKALAELHNADHIFLFLHHPRWTGGGYTGGNWNIVHDKLVAAGNVSAVFAGHIHHMRFDGPKDGIAYYTLATTGGHLSADIPKAGYLHHLNLVSVRQQRVTVSALPTGAVMDPKEFTTEFLDQISLARSIRPIQDSPPVTLKMDGSATATVRMTVNNPSSRPVLVTAFLDSDTAKTRWSSTLDHQHFELAAGTSTPVEFTITRSPGQADQTVIPAVRLQLEFIGETARIQLPDVTSPLELRPEVVPADYFANTPPHCLQVTNNQSAIRVPAEDIPLADGPMTLEAWVRPTTLTGYNGIIAKTQASEYAFFSDEGVPQFDIHLNGRYVTVADSNKLSPEKWTHLAGVFDGSQVMLFVDGKLVDTKQATGHRTTNKLPLFIGADTDGRGRPDRAYSGLIDEVRLSQAAIYNAAFSPSRRLQPTDDTVMLMHLDRSIGPFVLSETSSPVTGILGSASKLVPVED